MDKPRRIQRKRSSGFNLEAISRRANGLEYVIVDRSTIWGNPFGTTPGRHMTPEGRWSAVQYVPTREEAIERYRRTLMKGKKGKSRLDELRGKNLVCWRALDTPCHADVLLELANAPKRPRYCEQVNPMEPLNQGVE